MHRNDYVFILFIVGCLCAFFFIVGCVVGLNFRPKPVKEINTIHKRVVQTYLLSDPNTEETQMTDRLQAAYEAVRLA